MTPWAKLCEGRSCVACGRQDGTIVPAHANEQRFGKGMGIKAADWTVIPLCLECHTWLDNGPAPREEKLAAWGRWWIVHMCGLLQAELVGVLNHKTRPPQPYKRPSKILPRAA